MDEPKEKKGTLLRFLIVVGALCLVVILLGLFFLYNLFQTPPGTPDLDFSKLRSPSEILSAKGMAPYLSSSKPAVSPNTARVFFTTDGRYLSAELTEISRDLSSYERINRLTDRLIKGPVSKYFEPVIPPGTNLLGLYIGEDEVTLDFSKELQDNFQGGIMAGMLAVYSIVNTVTLNVEGIDRVQILIDGKAASTLAGEIDLSAPFGPNLNLIHW